MLWLVFGEINYNALPCCLKIILERSTRPGILSDCSDEQIAQVTAFDRVLHLYKKQAWHDALTLLTALIEKADFK